MVDSVANDQASMDALIAQQRQSIAGEEAQLNARQQAVTDQGVQNAQQRETGLAPIEKDLDQTLSQPVPQRPAATPLPEYKPKPLVDSKDFQSFGTALIAMAMIGGRASHGNWLGVSSTLNGALKGYLDGDKEAAARDYQKFETDFKTAQAKESQANKEFEDILNDRNATINQKIQQYKIAAAKYDRQDMLAAANQKSVDAMWKQLEAHKSALNNTEMRATTVKEQIDAHREAAKDRQAFVAAQNGRNSGGAGGLSPEALDKAAKFYNDTGTMPSLGNAKNTSATKMAILNRSAEMFPDSDVSANKIATQGAKQAYQQTLVRHAAIERITGSVQELQPRIEALTQKLNSSLGGEWSNRSMNDLKRQYGNNSDLQELDTLTRAAGRQYMEAITMPGSNAQMHVSAQGTADSMINGDMPPKKLVGAWKGINEDISAVDHSLTSQEEKLLNKARGVSSSTERVHWDDFK